MQFRVLRAALPALILLFISAIPALAQDGDTRALLHLLDYIGVDYPGTVSDGRIINPAEYAEMQEFAGRTRSLVDALPAGPARERARLQAQQLAELIAERVDGSQVSQLTRGMRAELIEALQVVTVPRKAPDRQRAVQLFESQCSSCHGISGAGDGPAAMGLEPAPTNFLDRERADQRSVFGLYSTITLGVADTAMRAFGELSDDDRWALAFHVGSLAYPVTGQGTNTSQPPSLTALTAMTPAEAIADGGEQALAALAQLRHDPSALFAGDSPFDTAIARLHESVAAYDAGDFKQAYSLSLSAYLDGFELAESALKAADPKVMKDVETSMLAFRQLIQNERSVAEVHSAAEALVIELDMARTLVSDSRMSAGVAMGSAFVILLREGLEALLVLAAIISVLIKTGHRHALPYVHVGWIGALALGVATWGVSTYLVDISGANRELTEGGTALLAALVLLYVGFWLHDKAHAAQWQAFVRKRIQGALSGSALWALTAVAFLAVYREVFETVLFYQALWMQADAGGQQALLGGVGLATVALLVLGWIILRTSARLPLTAFFRVNAVIMFVLAVVFAGHGVAGLQKAGVLPIDPVSFPQVELLGVYPSLESLGAQVLVILMVAALVIMERFRQPEA